MVSHFVGWAFKAVIFRNNVLVWTLSAAFEVYELSLRHWLPNFHECWWDHLLLDLFGCNLLGILLGNYLLRRLGLRGFHWFFEPTEHSEALGRPARLRYALTQVRAHAAQQKWHFLASPANFLTVLWLVLLNSLIDLSNFFNKKMLGLPASHYLLVVRILIIGTYSIVAIRELYDFTRLPEAKRKVPFNLYLGHFIVLAELALFLRNLNR